MGAVVAFFGSRVVARENRKAELKDDLVTVVVDIEKFGSQYWRSDGLIPPDEALIKSLFGEFRTRLSDYGEQHSNDRKIKDIADHHKTLWDLITGGDFETSHRQADPKRVTSIPDHVKILNQMIRRS